jgi:hypothetical protein
VVAALEDVSAEQRSDRGAEPIGSGELAVHLLEDRPCGQHPSSGKRPKLRDASPELGFDARRVARPKGIERLALEEIEQPVA